MSFIQQFFTSRDNNANAETFVGQEGRLWWDPVTNQIYSSDGNTPGGIPLTGGGGGNGTPGGSNSQVQFNNNGAFGGTANLTINSATGSLTAVSFAGDGSALTNITGANVVGQVAYAALANAVAGANVSGTVANATYATSAGSATTATTATTAGTVTANAQPNITSVGTLTSITTTGNVDAGGLYVGGSGVVTGNLQIQGNLTYNNLTNITTANLVFGLANNSIGVSANGAGWVVGNTNQASILYNYGTQQWDSNIGISAVGNIIGSNITTAGLISAAGNITGNYHIGNGSLLTGIVSNYGNSNVTTLLASLGSNAISSTANITTTANLRSGNLSVVGSINLGGLITATGNITGGNLLTGANVSAIGNVTGGNIITGGIVTTVSNVVANYFVGNGAALIQVNGANVTGTVANATYAVSAGSATSATTAATVTTAAQPNITSIGILNSLSVTGNIAGGNLITSGKVYVSDIQSGTTGIYMDPGPSGFINFFTSTGDRVSITDAGSVSAVGNITGSYFLGNGSQLTGLPATYGNANVVANLAALGTNPVSTTGNVTAGYFVGNGSLLTGISGGSSNRIFNGTSNVEIAAAAGNVTITAAAGNTWNFDTVGNLTLPGAIAGETIATQSGYITVGNLLVGAGGSLFNSNNDTWALYGNLSDPGVSITIPSNADAANSVPLNITSFSNVEISSGGTWAFNNDGTMTFPSNIIDAGANPITLWSTNSSTLLWRSPTGGGPGQPFQSTVSTNSGNATIALTTGTAGVGSVSTWIFNTANVVFPDATVQTTAYPGTATAFSVTGNVTGGNVIGTTGVSVGGTGGDLTMTGGAITGAGNITSNGIMAINAPGGITTTQASFDIVNATATTVNLGGSATAVNIGATTGTLTINNPNIVATQASIAVFNTTATAANIFGAASTIIMGAAGAGTLTLRNGTIVGSQATQNLFNTVATTVNAFGAANTLAIAAGATPSGTTKTIGIGENGVANSITNINFGTATGNGNVTFSANTLVRVANTSGTALSVAGNITGGNISTAGLITATSNVTGGNVLTGGLISATGNVTGGNVIATSTVYGNAATAFVAGSAAISGVALQMPQEGALRNLTNGLTNMYFDVSIGGTTQGQFQFRSSSSFTNVLTMSPTGVSFNTDATFTSRTPSLARTAFNSAIDTELTVDELRFRISNQGGIFPQVISNTAGSKNLGWTGVGAISGTAITQVGSTGTIVANNAWTTLYNAHGMDSAADTITVTLQDKVLGRIYRVTFMRSDNGSTTGYNIIAERLV